MEEFGSATFGQLYSNNYDQEHDPGTTTESVEFLARLCEDADQVLELAIGTGRIALPLMERGIRVHGIDASIEMLDQLKAKPAGVEIPVTLANMADFSLTERFDFAYLVFNTLFNLTSQEQQMACFRRVAKHLNPGGAFLIETIVPKLELFKNHQYTKTDQVGFAEVRIEAARHDPVHQVIECQRIHIDTSGTSLTPFIYRYAWPQEIDLMAKLAGFTREHRWGDWQGGEFTAHSPMHVSLYRKG